jgi:oligopeptide transport system permease protein
MGGSEDGKAMINSPAWGFSSQLIRGNWQIFWSLVVIGSVCLAALLSPWLTHYTFDQQNIEALFASPNSEFWMGTDRLGRDLFSRLLYGARVSLAVGVITALVALFIGSVYGALSGYFGGWVDHLMMRVVDVIYSVPTLVVMILVKVVFDSVLSMRDPHWTHLIGTMLAISLVSWVDLARLVRGQVLQTKELLYVEAGRALGVTITGLLKSHIFPNIVGPILVMLTFRIPSNILFESVLSFIGLGLQPPYTSWGTLVAEGIDHLETYPHLIFFPGLALFITMSAFQILGDGLRDYWDVKNS